MLGVLCMYRVDLVWAKLSAVLVLLSGIDKEPGKARYNASSLSTDILWFTNRPSHCEYFDCMEFQDILCTLERLDQ